MTIYNRLSYEVAPHPMSRMHCLVISNALEKIIYTCNYTELSKKKKGVIVLSWDHFFCKSTKTILMLCMRWMVPRHCWLLVCKYPVIHICCCTCTMTLVGGKLKAWTYLESCLGMLIWWARVRSNCDLSALKGETVTRLQHSYVKY